MAEMGPLVLSSVPPNRAARGAPAVLQTVKPEQMSRTMSGAQAAAKAAPTVKSAAPSQQPIRPVETAGEAATLARGMDREGAAAAVPAGLRLSTPPQAGQTAIFCGAAMAGMEVSPSLLGAQAAPEAWVLWVQGFP
jgi:hypothetical protein